MKLKLLGTAAAEGIPALFCACDTCKEARQKGGRNLRLRSCALVNQEIMIDFSPDMLHWQHTLGLDLTRLKGVVFTHSHIDHLAGGELCYIHPMYSNRQPGDPPLALYGNERVLEVLERDFAFDQGGVPSDVQTHLLRPFEPVALGKVTVTPLLARHDPRETCLTMLLEQEGTRVWYGNDSTTPPDETFAFLAGKPLDAAILDCTCGKESCKAVHMGFPENLETQKRLLDIGAADAHTRFFSHHFSHNGHVNYDGFPALAGESGFTSTYDGMELSFGSDTL